MGVRRNRVHRDRCAYCDRRHALKVDCGCQGHAGDRGLEHARAWHGLRFSWGTVGCWRNRRRRSLRRRRPILRIKRRLRVRRNCDCWLRPNHRRRRSVRVRRRDIRRNHRRWRIRSLRWCIKSRSRRSW